MKKILIASFLTKILLVAILTTAAFAMAQNAPPSTALPTTTSQFWEFAIAGITPLVVTFVGWLVPRIPAILLPVSTPFIGMLLGAGMNWLGHANLGWVDMGQAGLLAVGIHQIFTRAVTNPMKRGVAVLAPRTNLPQG